MTTPESLYRAGCVAAEVEAAFPGRVTPAALGKCADLPGRMAVTLRHVWPAAAALPAVAPLLADWEAPAGPTPAAEQGCFWIGYYHQKLARTLPETFPAKLAALIAAAGHATPAAFAAASGIAPQTLHNLLAGHRRPTWQTVQRLATALSVPTDSFRDRPEGT